ncbi:hypothetical protein GCM10009844_04250 [Nocardioides koreensis]|uniref:Sensor histidine kinase n=1 Tax=Nocardioides koreensis TaxID=433651 RepID=A0ABP5KTZ2_9ACTN
MRTSHHSAYRHGLLVHDTDEELIEGTRTFVARGLASGADVLVHGPSERVDLMREVLGSHPRLGYGFDEELYQAPMRTLFGYQHTLAERSEPRELWVTGTVPLGLDATQQAAWHRYESAVDEALGTYPFAALCTYDTRHRPASVIAAALATHRTVNVDLTDRENPQYVEPAAFLAAPLALRPEAPATPPSSSTVIHDFDHLSAARDLVRADAYQNSAVAPQTIEQLRVAVSEAVTNGLLHGCPPVRVTLWTDVASLTCLVEDSGPGHLDPMTGFRHPERASSMGLWVARQLVDDLMIRSSPSGGCSVLLTVTDQPL